MGLRWVPSRLRSQASCIVFRFFVFSSSVVLPHEPRGGFAVDFRFSKFSGWLSGERRGGGGFFSGREKKRRKFRGFLSTLGFSLTLGFSFGPWVLPFDTLAFFGLVMVYFVPLHSIQSTVRTKLSHVSSVPRSCFCKAPPPPHPPPPLTHHFIPHNQPPPPLPL